MKRLIPFSTFANIILEDVRSEINSFVNKRVITNAFKAIKFKSLILKNFPSVEFRNVKKPEVLYIIGLPEQMELDTYKKLISYIRSKIRQVFKEKLKKNFGVDYNNHKNVSTYSNSFEISVEGTQQKFYIIISKNKQNGFKNEMIQAKSINSFIEANKEEGKNYIPLIRYKPNGSNEFDVVYATRSEQVNSKTIAKADVVIYGYESLKELIEKPIMWISLKSGLTTKDFQQYLHISQSSITNMNEQQIDTSYITDFLKCCQLLVERDQKKYEGKSFQLIDSPVPENISKYAIYGRNFEENEFGLNNVNYLIQGDIQFKLNAKKKAYELYGSALTERHSNIPKGKYSPKILLRQSQNDKVKGFNKLNHHRPLIAPHFYNLTSTENLISVLKEEFKIEINSLDEFLRSYPNLENSNSSS